jgi:hypothetical protein
MTPAKLRLAQAAVGKRGTVVADLCEELGISSQTLTGTGTAILPGLFFWLRRSCYGERRSFPAAAAGASESPCGCCTANVVDNAAAAAV